LTWHEWVKDRFRTIAYPVFPIKPIASRANCRICDKEITEAAKGDVCSFRCALVVAERMDAQVASETDPRD